MRICMKNCAQIGGNILVKKARIAAAPFTFDWVLCLYVFRYLPENESLADRRKKKHAAPTRYLVAKVYNSTQNLPNYRIRPICTYL